MTGKSFTRSQRGYNRLAPSYHILEWLVFGKQLQRARLALIAQLPVWHRLLLLGDGDGRLLEQLFLQRCLATSHSPQSGRSSLYKRNSPSARRWSITSVDHSPAMLRRQRLRLNALRVNGQRIERGGGEIQFLQIDARDYRPPAQTYDVVVTPFFLDCFSPSELSEHLPLWLAALNEDGVQLHVDFISPHSAWQRPRAHLLLWAMHAFFGWQTGLTNRQLVDSQTLIEQCGLRKVAEHISGQGMIAAQLWQMDRACG